MYFIVLSVTTINYCLLQAMPLRQHNGPGFHYVVYWRRPDMEWITERIDDHAATSTIIPTDGLPGEYELRVRAANSKGMAATPWAIEVYLPQRNFDSRDENFDTEFDVSGSMRQNV